MPMVSARNQDRTELDLFAEAISIDLQTTPLREFIADQADVDVSFTFGPFPKPLC